MPRNIILVGLLLLCVMLSTPSAAAKIGAMGGFGPYWVEGDNFVGLAVTGYVDILGLGLDLSPTVGFWTGTVFGVRLTDVTPALAFKYNFATPGAQFAPYVGFAPALHFWFASGQSETYLGIYALGGVAINISRRTQMPIQIDFGFIFAEGRTVNTFIAKIGLATEMQR